MREIGALAARTRLVDDPGDLLALAPACGDGPLLYWEHPAGDRAMLALGVAREIRAHGARRFDVVATAAARMLATVDVPGEMRSDLRMVGGFAFSDAPHLDASEGDYPSARWVLPRRLWIREAGRTRVVEVWEEGDPPGPEAGVGGATGRRSRNEARDLPALAVPPVEPDERARWRRRVARAQALITAGGARKVVLARRRRLAAAGPIDPAVIVARVRSERPTCFTVWVRPRRGPSLVASTPELLVRRAGTGVTASALAGSAPRSTDAATDARLGAALLVCPKNGREHAFVAAAVRAALGAVGVEVAPARVPELLRLPEVQHLATVITGRLRSPRSLLELGAVLHPTPAVCGVPRDVARALIEAEEPERGWYTGALGWMDACGDGELVVTLRSALVADAELTLWAGAGIVEGSDADAELAETEAKMRALVAPFLEQAGGAPAAVSAEEPAGAGAASGA